jgi:hypothetical protein
VICSLALARLRTDIKGDLAGNNVVGMAQKLLLFWRKPARRCWWEGVELEDVEGVEGKLKVWIRRVWTLEMVSGACCSRTSLANQRVNDRVSLACVDSSLGVSLQRFLEHGSNWQHGQALIAGSRVGQGVGSVHSKIDRRIVKRSSPFVIGMWRLYTHTDIHTVVGLRAGLLSSCWPGRGHEGKEKLLSLRLFA